MTMLVKVPGLGLAFAGGTRCYLPPSLDGRDLSDPDCRFAAFMCLYAHRLEAAGRANEYTDDDAAAFACEALHADPTEPRSARLSLVEP